MIKSVNKKCDNGRVENYIYFFWFIDKFKGKKFI